MQDFDFFRQQIEQSLQIKHKCIDNLPESLSRASGVMIGSIRMGRKILSCGNGGSAGDAQHLASELVNRFATERMALPAISLVPDSSVITAIANDYGYEVIFSRQVEAIGRPGDVLVVFSTSGNSLNVVRAIEMAHQHEMRVIACTGNDGGLVAKILRKHDVEIRVPAKDTARIQEIHLLAIHSLCKAVDCAFIGSKFSLPDKFRRNLEGLVDLTHGLHPLGGCPRIRLSNEQPLVEFGEI
jgi:D-sedoheptulose 7-phosphate isomerase